MNWKIAITAVLVFIVCAFLVAAELTGNQASLFMIPAVEKLYKTGPTAIMATISGLAVSLMLFLLSLGIIPRISGQKAVVGFLLMAVGYLLLAIYVPPVLIAILIMALIGASSVVIAFIRSAAERVPLGGLPIAPNQLIGGLQTILAQLFAVAVAAGGASLGARTTWLYVAGMLVLAAVSGWFIFRTYGSSVQDTAQNTAGHRSWARAWNPWALRTAVVNGLSAMAIGALAGPLTSNIARFGLNQSEWVGKWGIGCVGVGLFLLCIWSLITPHLRDKGLTIGALVALVAAIYAVVERGAGGLAGGWALILIAGLTMKLAEDAFENSVYSFKPREAEALAINAARAFGYNFTALLSLLLVTNGQYTWIALIASVACLGAIFLWRKYWTPEIWL